MRRLTVLWSVAIALVLLGSAPAGAQSRGKEIVVGLGAEPRTMLAVTIVDWTTNNMLEHIYDRLLDRDAKTFKPKPMLAESWKIVNDTTWEFKLRKGVKFHNGEPFTAQSVEGHASTTRSTRRPRATSRAAAYWGLVKEVQIVDDYTVRFVTKQPWPSLVDSAASDQLAHDAGQGAQGARAAEARREADRHRAVPLRRVEARRAPACSSAIPTTGRAPPTSAASRSASSPSSARAWRRCSRARSTS